MTAATPTTTRAEQAIERLNDGCTRAVALVDDPRVWSPKVIKEEIERMRFDVTTLLRQPPEATR